MKIREGENGVEILQYIFVIFEAATGGKVR